MNIYFNPLYISYIIIYIYIYIYIYIWRERERERVYIKRYYFKESIKPKRNIITRNIRSPVFEI